MSARKAPPRTWIRRAFTVLEMMVVVAIMVLLTIGIAKVFRVTGDTVKAGRRVSTMNAYAAMLEKQMREDFSSITRDGFMVIRHRTAGGTPPMFTGAAISLAPGDAAPRARRVDEIIFFRTGDFTSRRDPVYPTVQAKSTEARIYYGQGLRKDPNSVNYYAPVALDDPNFGPDTPNFGQPGPNQYASDWTLLRHVTLLCQPKAMVEQRLPNTLVDPSPVYVAGDPSQANCEDLDGDIQVSLQPAAPGIYRNLFSVEPNATFDLRFGNAFVVRDDSGNGGLPQVPQFSSGAVDIATTDLSEIRSILLDAQPVFGRTTPFTLAADGDAGSFFYTDMTPAAPNSVTKIMHEWMRQALPANSDAGVRMRYEPKPPDFLGNLGSASGAVFAKEYQRTDQMMLSAFNFIPGCSEFIVEWSFGLAYPADDSRGRAGQLIWHGLQRDGGVTPTGQQAYAALPYGDPLNAGVDLYHMPYRRLDGSIGYWPPKDPAAATGYPTIAGINRNVVREFNPFAGNTAPEYSYFGYVDPTYRMRSAWTDLNNDGIAQAPSEIFQDKNNNGVQDIMDEPTLGNGDIWFDYPVNNVANGEVADPREPQTIPWAWPKLIRVTISLTDPTDPLREQSFQFIFELPQALNDAVQ